MASLRGAGQCTEIALSVKVASNQSFAGQTGQVTPSVVLFGSPDRASAQRLVIIAFDSARRPGLLAVLFWAFENTFGPKLPKRNSRSNAWAAPYTSFQGAGSWARSEERRVGKEGRARWVPY